MVMGWAGLGDQQQGFPPGLPEGGYPSPVAGYSSWAAQRRLSPSKSGVFLLGCPKPAAQGHC